MSDPENKAAKVEGPRAMIAGADNRDRYVAALPVTGAAVALDILGDANAPITAGVAAFLPLARSRLVKLLAQVDTYYLWSDDPAVVIDETATGSTTPRQQCAKLVANFPEHEYPQGRYLIVKGSAGILRMSIASP